MLVSMDAKLDLDCKIKIYCFSFYYFITIVKSGFKFSNIFLSHYQFNVTLHS